MDTLSSVKTTLESNRKNLVVSDQQHHTKLMTHIWLVKSHVNLRSSIGKPFVVDTIMCVLLCPISFMVYFCLTKRQKLLCSYNTYLQNILCAVLVTPREKYHSKRLRNVNIPIIQPLPN